MSPELCTVCGEEIPRSLLKWLKESPDTPEDGFFKGYACAMFSDPELKYHYSGQRRETKFFMLLENGEYKKPICFKCLMSGFRLCMFCGSIHKTQETLSMNMAPYEALDACSTPCHPNSCEDPNCQAVNSVFAGEWKYPGYTKDLKNLYTIQDLNEYQTFAQVIALKGLSKRVRLGYKINEAT